MRVVCQAICFAVFRRRAGLHGHRGARARPQPLDHGPDRRAVSAGHGEHPPPRRSLAAAGSLRRRCRAGHGCRAGGRVDRQSAANVECVGLFGPLAQSVGPNLPALYDVLVLAQRAGSADPAIGAASVPPLRSPTSPHPRNQPYVRLPGIIVLSSLAFTCVGDHGEQGGADHRPRIFSFSSRFSSARGGGLYLIRTSDPIDVNDVLYPGGRST